jgi:MFS family permease
MDVTDKPVSVGVRLDEATEAEMLSPGDVAILSEAPDLAPVLPAGDKAKLDRKAKVSLGVGLWLVIIGTLLMRVGGAAVGLMLQLFTAHIALSAAIVGVVGVSFYLSELFGAPYFGTRIDKQGWRRYLLAGPLIGAAGVLLTALAGLFPLLLVVPLLFITRLLGGLSVATNTPASLSYLSAAGSKDAQVRSRSVGYFELAVVAGTALGGLLGGVLWDYLKLWGFVALAVLYLLTWVMLRTMPHDVREKPAETAKHNPLGLLKSRTLWEFAPAWIAVNALYGVLANNGVRMLADKEDKFPHQLLVGLFREGGTGYLFGVFAIVLSIGILLWTRILPHMRSSTAMVVSLLGAGGACAVLYAMNHAPTAGGLSYWLLVSGLAVGFLVLSGFTPAALSVLVQIGEKNHTDRGAVMGAYSVLLGLGQFLGGAIGGFAATIAGFDGLITLTSIIAVLSLMTMIHWRMVERNY